MNEAITGQPIGKYELTLVTTGHLTHVLENVEEMMQDEFETRSFHEWDMDELKRRLYSGESQLWLVAEKGVKLVMVVVTRILRYPCVKRLSVDFIVGDDLEGCAILLEAIGNWSKRFGCSEIEASCRPGITRVMRKHGFQKQYDVIVKSIAGSTH